MQCSCISLQIPGSQRLLPFSFLPPSTPWASLSRSHFLPFPRRSFGPTISTKSLSPSQIEISTHLPSHLRAVPSRNKTETPEASILPNGRKSRQPTRLAVEGPKGLRIGLYYCFSPRGISISQFASSSHSIIHVHHQSASASTPAS
jgi:hypothetical protein